MRRLLAVLCLLAAPALFAQSADQQIVSVTDAPDPVTPGTNVTYTVTIRNNGPDAAVNGGVNVNFPVNVTYQSATPPAGWSCSTFGQALTCNTPSFASGAQETFTIVAQLAGSLVSFPDGSFSTSFSTSGTTPDPNNGNNSANVTTSYDTPQIDMTLSVSDSPDPVAPNGNITYTVQVGNSGPDTGTTATLNTFNNGSLKFVSATVPAGWSCTLPSVNAAPTFTCTNPTYPSGSSSTFTIVVNADPAILGINDGSVSTAFSASATGNETNNANNSETETTAYVTPDADMAISVTDSPDPVNTNNNITYTVTVQNNGPDTATNATLNTFNNGSLRFQSATVPAGWNCTLPALNAAPTFTCTNPSFANGASSVFTVVARVDQNEVGINDGQVSVAFSASSGVADPNNANNSETETTNFVNPDADLQITATDSPDPVAPDGNITYTVTVTNAGPDAATSSSLSVPLNNTLLFQSITVPAGWSCSPPPVNGGSSFSCTNPSFGVGSSVFTIVLKAAQSQFGINDQTINQAFTISSGVADPNNANNSVTVSTQYVTPDANMAVTASDSPDPVPNGANVTFSITVTNGGPDTATNAQMAASPDPSLTFQSLTAPAGWTCTTPAVDAAGVVQCTNPSLANGGTANFTLVAKVVKSGSAGGTLTSTFSTSSGVQDPNNTNNSVTVTTNWIGQTSDLSISKSTLATMAAQGSNITYTISTSNAGPDAASNVTVTDVLNASLRFQSITAPAGWNCTTPAVGTSGTITCTAATFANGANASFTLVVSVAPNATGSISNTATIGFTGGSDPNASNSSGASGAVVVGGSSDLSVTKTTGTTTVLQGGTLSYTINVSNAGPDPAASVTMTDVLPPSLRFQSINAPGGWNCTTPAVGTNGTISCTTASLASGATASFTLTTTVAPAATGTVTNTASASHSGTDANPGNSSGSSPSTTITPSTSADLAVTKTTLATSVAPGQTFAYTISVTNSGPDAATGVVMTDTLPASLLFQSIGAPAGFTCTTPGAGSTGTITCNGATLASGATANFTLTVAAAGNATGTIVNSAAVTSSVSDPNGGNNGGTSPALPVVPAASTENIPTLAEWALLALALMIAVLAMRRM